MSVTGAGGAAPDHGIDGLAGASAEASAQAGEAPAHDHAEALRSRPRIFASGNIGASAMVARLNQTLASSATAAAVAMISTLLTSLSETVPARILPGQRAMKGTL